MTATRPYLCQERLRPLEHFTKERRDAHTDAMNHEPTPTPFTSASTSRNQTHFKPFAALGVRDEQRATTQQPDLEAAKVSAQRALEASLVVLAVRKNSARVVERHQAARGQAALAAAPQERAAEQNPARPQQRTQARQRDRLGGDRTGQAMQHVIEPDRVEAVRR